VTTPDLLARLRQAGVDVRLRPPDRLVLSGDVIPPDLVELTREHKPQLLADLAEEAAVRNASASTTCPSPAAGVAASAAS